MLTDLKNIHSWWEALPNIWPRSLVICFRGKEENQGYSWLPPRSMVVNSIEASARPQNRFPDFRSEFCKLSNLRSLNIADAGRVWKKNAALSKIRTCQKSTSTRNYYQQHIGAKINRNHASCQSLWNKIRDGTFLGPSNLITYEGYSAMKRGERNFARSKFSSSELTSQKVQSRVSVSPPQIPPFITWESHCTANLCDGGNIVRTQIRLNSISPSFFPSKHYKWRQEKVHGR